MQTFKYCTLHGKKFKAEDNILGLNDISEWFN